MPISAIDGCGEAHWESVRSIIKEALLDTEFSVELVSDSNESGIIQKRIVQNIYDNDMIICDVSAKNPNVMFELGLRLAFDKPAIIIKDDKTGYTFDTGQIEHLEYPRALGYHAMVAFKRKLKEKALATHSASQRNDYTTFLKHFGKFTVAKLEKEELNRDDFILRQMQEMRAELSNLRVSLEKASGKAEPNKSEDDFVNELVKLIDLQEVKQKVGLQCTTNTVTTKPLKSSGR